MAALNLGNVSFGVGLLLAPLLLSFLFRKLSYENSVSVLAVIIRASGGVGRVGNLPGTGSRGLRVLRGAVLAGQPGGGAGLFRPLLLHGLGRLVQQLAAGLRKRGHYGGPTRRRSRRRGRLGPAADLGVRGGHYDRAARGQPDSGAGQARLLVHGRASVLVALFVAWMAWTRRPPVAWLLVFAVGLLTAPVLCGGGGRHQSQDRPVAPWLPRSASSSPGAVGWGHRAQGHRQSGPRLERPEEHGPLGPQFLAILVVLALILHLLPLPPLPVAS